MSGSHRTSAIARPRTVSKVPARASSRRPAAVPRDAHTRLSELTTPIARDRQLVQRWWNRWVLAFAAIAVLGALLAALFVLPVQAWMRQKDEIATKQSELDVLDAANDALGVDIGHLQTPEGAKEAARAELGVVGKGEDRISVLPDAAMVITLPAGWPYDSVRQIVQVRATEMAVPPATTVAPATTVIPAATVAP
jgi:cell division protein FtsB